MSQYARYFSLSGGGSGVTSINTLTGAITLTPGTNITFTTVGNNITINSSGGGGGGTVTSVSVVSANGLSGTVATPTTTPAITLAPTFTGITYSTGSAFQAAVAANFPTLNQNTTGTAANITATSNNTLTTLSALSLPGAQVTGNISGNAANITATSNSTLTTLSALSLPTSQLSGTISLTSQVSGTLPVANGGSGAASFTAYSPIVGGTTSTNPFQSVSTSGAISGQYLTYQGPSALPIWSTISGGTAFFAASSLVNTASTGITSTSPTIFDNSPAFSFTPTVTGTYKIYGSVTIQDQSNALLSYCKILASIGSPTQVSGNVAVVYSQTGAPVIDSVYLETVYTLIAGTPYTFDIYGWVQAGNTIGTRGDQGPFNLNAEQVATGTAANLVIGAIDGNGASANGLSISASTLYAQSASSGSPGMVNNTSQTFSGSKNFTSPIGYNNTTPNAATSLDIINTTGATQRIVQTGYGGQVGMRGRYANGSLGTPTAATSGNILSFISGMGYGANQFPASSTGAVNIVAGETFTNTSNLTYISLSTTPTGSITTAESMRVASTGVTLGPQSSSTAVHQINGGLNYTTRTVASSTFTVDTTTTDYIIYTDSTSNAITITLPAPTNGRELIIQDKTGKAATNNITINPHAAETINGLSTFIIAANYGSCLLTSDGTNWVAQKTPTSGSSLITGGTTYTTPVNITPQTRFKFTLIGGGGGAGGINTAADAAAGGGAGAAVLVYATGLSANTTYTVAIGVAGTAGASTPTAGGNGGATSITFLGSTYTAGGGSGANDTATSNGGAGGTATSSAGTGVSTIVNMPGGGGGSASGVTTNGSGQGGNTLMGWGGQGVIAAGNGNAGTGYGGGGSGGKGAAAAGGAGAAGCILVEWWN